MNIIRQGFAAISHEIWRRRKIREIEGLLRELRPMVDRLQLKPVLSMNQFMERAKAVELIRQAEQTVEYLRGRP